MLASVFNSEIAIEASVRVVRAFVKLREMVSGNVQLATKLAQLERRLDSHDAAIAQLFAAIRQLLSPPEKPKPRDRFPRAGTTNTLSRPAPNQQSEFSNQKLSDG